VTGAANASGSFGAKKVGPDGSWIRRPLTVDQPLPSSPEPGPAQQTLLHRQLDLSVQCHTKAADARDCRVSDSQLQILCLQLSLAIVIVAEFGAVSRDEFWLLGSLWQVWTGEHNSSTQYCVGNLGGFLLGCNGSPISLIAVRSETSIHFENTRSSIVAGMGLMANGCW
jgi:hypothetical protein